ncbi:radical SAM family heme chaperone HemW [Candidatus Latescibacterota bacterium]
MPYGLYIHLPFCRSKCPYCSFTSITGGDHLIGGYVESITRELDMRSTGPFEGSPTTIYIGGGTPSMVPHNIMTLMLKRFEPINAQEATVEANPESIDDAWLDSILERGINRISIGVQSLDDTVLASLGRIHTSQQGIDAVAQSRRAGFKNISADLMFGVPGQTMKVWEDTLQGILDLEPNHLSCYSLGIEEDTEFFLLSREKSLDIPDAGLVADMYAFMVKKLADNGLSRYEISNFSQPGYECLHNLSYWDFTPYLGIGVSAHSFDGRMRRWNRTDIHSYIQACNSGIDPVSGAEILDEEKYLMEMVMLRLRTSVGLEIGRLRCPDSSRRYLNNVIDKYKKAGLMDVDDDGRVRLTSRGAIVSDELIAEIVSEIV